MWWAENEVGLAKVLEALTRHSRNYPQQPHLEPSPLLVEAVQSGQTLQKCVISRRNSKKGQ